MTDENFNIIMQDLRDAAFQLRITQESFLDVFDLTVLAALPEREAQFMQAELDNDNSPSWRSLLVTADARAKRHSAMKSPFCQCSKPASQAALQRCTP